MTITVTSLAPDAGASPGPAARRRSIRALGRLEARRNLRSPWVLVVAAYTAWTARNASGMDWSGATYGNLPLLFVPLSALAFYQGLRAAGRDRQGDLPALAEEAPLGEEARVWGRLLGLTPLVALAVAGVVVIEVAARIEGGYWLGEGIRGTFTAQHRPVELLQPPLLVAVAATAGVALGRRFRNRLGVGIAAGVFWFLQWGVWWAFQWTPMVVVTFATTQPMSRYAGPEGSGYADFPEDWYVTAPEFDLPWMRQVVHEPFVAAHVVYLAGLAVLFTSSALRHRAPGVEGQRSPLGRRLRRVGWATGITAVLLQLWALEWGITPGGDGLAQVP